MFILENILRHSHTARGLDTQSRYITTQDYGTYHTRTARDINDEIEKRGDTRCRCEMCAAPMFVQRNSVNGMPGVGWGKRSSVRKRAQMRCRGTAARAPSGTWGKMRTVKASSATSGSQICVEIGGAKCPTEMRRKMRVVWAARVSVRRAW